MADSTDMLSDNLSIGDAVSDRDVESLEGEEDIYYIPERRPSLDLEPAPMDTSHWHFVEQALAPAQSYETLNSEEPEGRAEMTDSPTRVQLERADSFSSCYSIDSDDCEKTILREKTKEKVPETSNQLVLIQEPEAIKHPSLTLKFTFKALCDTLTKLHKDDLGMFKWELWTHYPQPFSAAQSMDIVDLVDRLLETFTYEMSVQITRTILVSINKSQTADFLRILCIKNQVRHELQEDLIKKFSEETIMEGKTMPLDEIYTDFHIYGRPDNGPNTEHEIRDIGQLNMKREPEKQFKLSETLTLEMLNKTYARQMYILGMVGSGKSTFVKKLALDWAWGRSHQHFSFVFLLTFRELKQFIGKQISLQDIILTMYPVTKKLVDEGLKYNDKEALFIFDGLDEYEEKLNYADTEFFSDRTSQTRFNVIMVNIIRDRLLGSSRVLLTTRPQAIAYYPWDGHFDEIEMCGFSDEHKEEYFKKRFKDPNQAAMVIEYVKSMKTLHIMCHLPLFCTLVAEECERVFRESGAGAKFPRNLTYMYTKLLLTLLRFPRKRGPDLTPEEQQTFLIELGKVALSLLEQNKCCVVMMRWPKTCPMKPAILSGLCTQFTNSQSALFYEEMIGFLHTTVQEYLVALYAYLSYRNQDKIVFDQPVKFKLKMNKGPKIMELYKVVVENSLQREDGKLDMVLRFLFGMACKTNQELLSPFLKPSAKVLDITKDCASLIKKNQGGQNPDRDRNLLRCLDELQM